VTVDRRSARDDEEYVIDEDPREEVQEVVDVELGPISLDLLGLEIHLDRLHAAIVANSGPDHALVGQILAQLGSSLEKLGLGKLVGGLTTAVEGALDALPSPEGDGTDEGSTDESSSDDGDDDGSSMAEKLTSPLRKLLDLAKRLFPDDAGSAVSSAAGAAKHAAKAMSPDTGTFQRMREGKKAADGVGKASKGAANLVTGRS
jgi:hypothetical protein